MKEQNASEAGRPDPSAATVRKPRAAYFYDPRQGEKVYGPQERALLAERLDLEAARVLTRTNWREHRGLLARTRILVSTWGGPVVDEEFLEAAPELDLLLYGAGSIRGTMTAAAWERGVRVTTAAEANAVSVAHFSVSQILFCLKNGWQLSRRATAGENSLWGPEKPMPGTFGTTVGLVSLGLIGTKVAELLEPFGLRVLAYDPLADDEHFDRAGAEKAGLEDLFAASDVVSIHAPLLPATRGLIHGGLLRSLKPGAGLINTARGPVIDEPSLVEVFSEREDLTAVLDVSDPEPPAPDSPLRRLPNIVLTPHIAGAFNRECRRLGRAMVGELERYLRGEPLLHEIHAREFEIRA